VTGGPDARASGAPAPRRAATRRDELAGSLLTACMALAFGWVVILGKDAISGHAPFTLLSLRFGGTTVILVGVLVATGKPLAPVRGERVPIVIAGTLGYGSEAAFFFSAVTYGSAAAVTLLFYTYPVFVMLATWALDRRPPSRLLFLALSAALLGAAVVIVGGGSLEVRPVGIALVLACAALYTATWLAGSAALMNVVLAVLWQSWDPPRGEDWWPFVGMSVATAVAFVFMIAGLQRIGAVRNAIIGVLEPFAVAVLAFLVLHEPVRAPTAVGGVLILGGAVVATLVRTTRVREPDL